MFDGFCELAGLVTHLMILNQVTCPKSVKVLGLFILRFCSQFHLFSICDTAPHWLQATHMFDIQFSQLGRLLMPVPHRFIHSSFDH